MIDDGAGLFCNHGLLGLPEITDRIWTGWSFRRLQLFLSTAAWPMAFAMKTFRT